MIPSSKTEYELFIDKIEKEWTGERITRWLLEREIKSYRFFRSRREQAELENKDARVKGMSYKDRQKYTRQINALDQLMKESVLRGMALRYDLRTKFWGHRMARMWFGEDDMEAINRDGFEKHLKYVTMIYK